MSDPRQPGHDEDLEGLEEIGQAWLALPREEPGAHLDAAIIARAHAANASASVQSRGPWMRWGGAFALAATVVMSVSIVLRQPRDQALDMSARQARMPPPAADPVPDAATAGPAAPARSIVAGEAPRTALAEGADTGRAPAANAPTTDRVAPHRAVSAPRAGADSASKKAAVDTDRARPAPATAAATPPTGAVRDEALQERARSSPPATALDKPAPTTGDVSAQAAAPQSRPPPEPEAKIQIRTETAPEREMPPEQGSRATEGTAVEGSALLRRSIPVAPLGEPLRQEPATDAAQAARPVGRARAQAPTDAVPSPDSAAESGPRSGAKDGRIRPDVAPKAAEANSTASSPPTAGAVAVDSPGMELERIRKLWRAGHVTEARRRMAEFRQRHPDFALDASDRAMLPEPPTDEPRER